MYLRLLQQTVYTIDLPIYVVLPVITKHPNYNGPITVAEGSDVTLRCKATGDGMLNYQWIREFESLPRKVNGGENLTIHNIAVSDSGRYYCEVSNKVGNTSSMIVQVTVKSKL